jgi:hypothetical protein
MLRYILISVLVMGLLSGLATSFIYVNRQKYVSNKADTERVEQGEGPKQAPPLPEVVYSPYDCVRLAAEDTQALTLLNDPELDPKYVRYLALYNYPKALRIKLKKAIDFVINSLNTEYRQIIRTAFLPADADDPIILRINLQDYGIDPKAWDDLAEKGSGRVPLPDPYFHKKVEIISEKPAEYDTRTITKEKTVTDQNGYKQKKTYKEEEKYIKNPAVKEKKIVLASAPWLAVEDKGVAIADLIKNTQTKNPILRADWFLAYATQPPAYYQLIGIKGKVELVGGIQKIKKGEKEFEKLALIDEQLAKKSRVAAIADSKIVTLNNRILTRFPTVAGYTGGYYWRSSDTKTGLNDEDYLNALANFDKPKIAAQELIATAINTLQIYALTDAEENLVLFADPQVAIHGDQMSTRLQDKLIYAGIRNCTICHYEGMVAIRDKVRGLAQGKISLFISKHTSPEERKNNVAKKIKEAFSPDIKGLIQHDNAIHAAAILACNDMKPLENKDNIEDFLVLYLDTFLTVDMIAREVGWPKDKLLEALKRAVGLDHTVVSMLQVPVISISRIPWENQGFDVLMSYLLSIPKQK